MSTPTITRDFWLDTGWACGAVRMDSITGQVVKGGAPIFDRFIGQRLLQVIARGRYKLESLQPLRIPIR